MQKLFVVSSVSLIAIAGFCSAQAQISTSSADQPSQAANRAVDARDSQADLQEITVTAQRYSQTLQKASLTIQVLQPDELAAAGVTTPSQLTQILPGIQVGTAGPLPSVYIRGVGSLVSTAGQSPAIPFYVDGIYLGRSESLPSEFYDVDRVEVVKGPQGTLYGRNASGGAINVLTKKPELGVFDGRAELELGNFSNQSGELAVNVPLGETVALRGSAQIVDRGGYTSDGFGDDVHQSGRIKLLWEPNSDVSLLLNGSYGHIGGKGAAEVLLNRDVPGWYSRLGASSPQAQALSAAAPFNAIFPGAVVGTRPEQGFQDLNFWNVSAEFDWKVASDITFTLLPAYRDMKSRFAALPGFLYGNGIGFGDVPAKPETSKQTSVEARLSGDSDQLKWVSGIYFYNEDQTSQFFVSRGPINSAAYLSDYGTRSYAAFGQASLSITKDIRLIGGARYTSDRRSLSDGASYYLAPSLLGPGGLPCFPPTGECLADQYAGQKSFNNFSWKAGVETDVLNNSLLYGTVSRGFKAGGFNQESSLENPGDATKVGGALLFEPEKLTSYEVGLKNRFLDNRLQVNVQGFYWDYRGHQEPELASTKSGFLNLVYFNAGKIDIYGAGADILARPWEGGTISISSEYAHSRYKDFVTTTPTAFFNPASTGCPSTSIGATTYIDCSGFQVARTPEWTGEAGFTQEFQIGVGKLVGNATVNYASSRWLASDFLAIERASAYAVVNASITYHSPGDRWFLMAFVRNLNNGNDYSFAYYNSFANYAVAAIGTSSAYGARLGFSW